MHWFQRTLIQVTQNSSVIVAKISIFIVKVDNNNFSFIALIINLLITVIVLITVMPRT